MRAPTGRWSGNTRDWSPIGAVTLNPERDAVVNRAAGVHILGTKLHDSGDNYLDMRRNITAELPENSPY